MFLNKKIKIFTENESQQQIINSLRHDYKIKGSKGIINKY